MYDHRNMHYTSIKARRDSTRPMYKTLTTDQDIFSCPEYVTLAQTAIPLHPTAYN